MPNPRAILLAGLSASLLVALAACGAGLTWRDEVRQQAARDCRCPLQSVEIMSDDEHPQGRTVRLEVCGRVRVYRELSDRERARQARGDEIKCERRWRKLRRQRRQRPRKGASVARRPRRDEGPSGVERRRHRKQAATEAPTRSKRRRQQNRRKRSTAKQGRGLDGRSVRRVIEKSFPRIEQCYKRALRHHPKLCGAIIIRFVVGPRGKVIESAPASSELLPEIGECVAGRIKELRFPRPAQGRMTFHYPFIFER